MNNSRKSLGPCCLCQRDMLSGNAVDRHHHVPRSQGGKEWVWMHKICHRKLHSMWTEKQLARDPILNSPLTMGTHPDLATFIAWVPKHPSDYYTGSRTAKQRRR